MIISDIKNLAEKVNPEYSFEYQTLFTENIKAMDKNVGDKFLFLEERKSGYISGRYHLKRTINFNLYVCTLIDILETDTAEKREVIRQEMLNDFIIPFIKEFRTSNLASEQSKTGSVPFETPLPMFDNFAVVEILGFQAEETIC